MLDIVRGAFGTCDLALQSAHGLFEIEYFPKCDSQVQDSDSGYGAAHPARGNNGLQTIEAGLVRRVKQKIIIAPITQAKKTLRDPGHEREHQADLEAKNDVEDNAKLG